MNGCLGILRKWVVDVLNRNEHFAYEGHFTNEATWDVPKRFKHSGYSIHLLFFGLTDQNLSEMRVIERSKSGGHYVNPTEIDMNFRGNLLKLDEHFELIDDLQIVDTSETQHKILLRCIKNEIISAVPFQELPPWFTDYLPSLTRKMFL
jgi:predicted ABC-type ATPase